MSVWAEAVNIQNPSAVIAEGVQRGDDVLIVVTGGQSGKFIFEALDGHRGIRVRFADGTLLEPPLLWGDIVEFHVITQKWDQFRSDVPEVAEVLKRIKSAMEKCVQDDNVSAVIYLRDQMATARLAEVKFKEARELLSSVRM